MEKFKAHKDNVLAEKDKIAKEQFNNLSDSIKKIAVSHGVNPEKIVSSSLKPEEASAVEGIGQKMVPQPTSPNVPAQRAKNSKTWPSWIERSQPPEREDSQGNQSL